jgi:hypothetical protein
MNFLSKSLTGVLIFCFGLSFFSSYQTVCSQTFKVEARRWVKDKPNQPWTFFDTQIIDSLKGFKPTKVDINAYGSNKSVQLKGTGFFRTEKVNNRWWIVDPEGYLNIQRVVNGLRQGNSEKNKLAFESIYKTTENWTRTSYQQFSDFGFNGIGSWSDTEAVQAESKRNKCKISYSVMLNFMSGYGKKRGGTYQLPGNTGYPHQCVFVFDKEFEKFCDDYAKIVESYMNDSNLVGFFSDNELPFGTANLEGYLTLPDSSDQGRKFAEHWLKSKKITVSQLKDNNREEFAGVVADNYYRIVSTAIRKYDKNHLFLGSRLHGSPKHIESIVRAAGKYSDVVSINYYGSWGPDQNLMKNWGEWAGKPFMITEFYTKAMDSGLANTTGAGFTVHSQQDRGFAYQHFCLGLLQSTNCVGWHWFRYQDNDPTAKGADPSNLDSNKGLLNTEYKWYSPMIKYMKQLNENVYSLVKYYDKN